MDIYQHFRKEEHSFVDQVISWKEQVQQTYVPRLSDFLDPRERHIVRMIIGEANDELKLHEFGGDVSAERKRMLVAPYYEVVTEEAFQVTLLQAAYQDKFVAIEHRDVMGSFLSLGIKRSKLGDIYADAGILQIVLAEEIAEYVVANLTSVKKAKVTFAKTPIQEKRTKEEQWLEADKTVSSLRLDAVLKEIYHISRSDAQNLIGRQLVKVNYKIVDESKFMLEQGDLISLRGKGRSRILEINGISKKEKWKIRVATLK